MTKTPSSFEFADRTQPSDDGGPSAARKVATQDEKEPSPIEAFDEEGAGIAAKE